MITIKNRKEPFSMAAFLLFLLQFSFHKAVAQPRQLNISIGSSLSPTGKSTWLSRSGLFAFGFYQQANDYAVGVFVAGVPEKTVVWTANRDNPFVPRNSTLNLTIDGRLILLGEQGENIPVTDTSESITAASMLDSGNFVLYNSAQRIIWQSFDHPTDTLLPGQRLKADQELISSASEINVTEGFFRLKMQTDGNLVQYPVDTPDSAPYAYWSSGTDGWGPNVSLNLNNDAHLYLFNSSIIIKNLTVGGYSTQRTIYFMKINSDGIFRLYSQNLDRTNSSMIWQSSGDRCDPKGLCGINSFCTRQDTEVDCKCLPGFDFVIQGNWRLGCAANSTTSCKDEDRSANYSMRSLDNTVWEDQPYAHLRTETREDCEKACLDDSNCQAAFLKDGNCKKQKFPLRYGKRLDDDSNIAFIKVCIPAAHLPPGISIDHPKTSTKKEIRMEILIISITLIGVAGLFLVISGVLIYINRKRNRNYRGISSSKNLELIDNVATRIFTYEELQRATHNFKEELGRGGFGTVYKATLPDYQKAVAVKKLEKVFAEGEKEFQNEIRAIGKTHHRNLVQLLGYCLDGSQRLLVYEYMSNGSLDKILFNSENVLNWDERIEIALDVSRGILYLHEECETQIIHCDIKPQNILLDEYQRAKISDFGLSKLLNYDQTRTYTAARGTKGYVAPEWYRGLHVTAKVDVYSFGIVLLEIVCHRKNVNWSYPENEAILHEWVYTCYEARELQKLVGDEEVDRRKLERMIKIGLWCTQDEPSLRPSMKKVSLMLEGTVDIPVPPHPSSFLSAL